MIIAYIISFILFLTVIITFKYLLKKQQQYFLNEIKEIQKMYEEFYRDITKKGEIIC